MAKYKDLPKIPLPRSWPGRVKSAAPHAISVAQLALGYTRCWAVNSQVARVWLKANNDQLTQQVALLAGAFRITDVSMTRISPPST